MSHSRITTLLILLSVLIEHEASDNGLRNRPTPFHENQIQRFMFNRCHGLVNNGLVNDDRKMETLRREVQNENLGSKTLVVNNIPKEKQYSKGYGAWVYEGQLINPFTGEKICEVEGIELTRHLVDVKKQPKIETFEKNHQINQFNYLLGRLGNLRIRNLLSAESKDIPEWDYASTFFSRKLFCYRDPSAKRQLLSRFQRTPGIGKTRKLKIEEATAMYDTATTYISRNGGREMMVVTEFPNGRCILAQAQVKPSLDSTVKLKYLDDTMIADKFFAQKSSGQSTSSVFEFNTYGKLRNAKAVDNSQPLKFPPLLNPESETQRREETQDKNKPARKTWVQFGPDDREVQNERYGALESYSFYNMDAFETYNSGVDNEGKSKSAYHFLLEFKNRITTKDESNTKSGSDEIKYPIVKYSRYGECPPWYGPNQMCTLELVGRRVDSLRDAPPLAASIASHAIPGFASVSGPIPFGDTIEVEKIDKTTRLWDPISRKIINWFRQNHLKFDDEYVPFGMSAESHLGFLGGNNSRIRQLLEKFRASTTNVIQVCDI